MHGIERKEGGAGTGTWAIAGRQEKQGAGAPRVATGVGGGHAHTHCSTHASRDKRGGRGWGNASTRWQVASPGKQAPVAGKHTRCAQQNGPPRWVGLGDSGSFGRARRIAPRGGRQARALQAAQGAPSSSGGRHAGRAGVRGRCCLTPRAAWRLAGRHAQQTRAAGGRRPRASPRRAAPAPGAPGPRCCRPGAGPAPPAGKWVRADSRQGK